MNCPICGSTVVYQGLSSIECSGKLVYLGEGRPEGPCQNYREPELVREEDWVARIRESLRNCVWLSECRVVANMYLRPGECVFHPIDKRLLCCPQQEDLICRLIREVLAERSQIVPGSLAWLQSLPPTTLVRKPGWALASEVRYILAAVNKNPHDPAFSVWDWELSP